MGRLSLPLAAALFFWTTATVASAECVVPPAPQLTEENTDTSTGQSPLGARIAAAAQELPTPELESSARALGRDRVGRVVAPVYINGEGPFRFIVDTGANRSAISSRLADNLGLERVGSGEVHSIDTVEPAPFVAVRTLEHGALRISDAQLPALAGGVFGAEQGLLGVEGFAGRRLRINMEEGCIEIRDARNAPPLLGWGRVHGELRFGRLMVADGRIRGVPVKVLIDTGSDISLGNLALREALDHARGRRTDLHSYTAGDLLVLERAVIVPHLLMGDVEINNILAYVDDFHIFSLWGLDTEPTLLLGMDVISQAREIAIDYSSGVLSIRLEGGRYSRGYYRRR